MKPTSVLLMAGLLVLASCRKDGGEIPTSGIATMDSRLYFNDKTQNYFLYGFDFEKGKTVKYEFMVSGAGTDLVLSPLAGIDGGYFTSPGNDEAFYMAESFDNPQAAQDYYTGLTLFAAPAFTEWANPLLANQVWIIRTLEDRYAKIWIQSVETRNDTEGDYVQVTFAWTFQPDGSTTFPE